MLIQVAQKKSSSQKLLKLQMMDQNHTCGNRKTEHRILRYSYDHKEAFFVQMRKVKALNLKVSTCLSW